MIQEKLRGVREKTRETANSTTNHERKHKIRSLYLHNYSLKFPLHKRCIIPFSKAMKETKLRNNSQFILNTGNAFIRQTTKNLIIYPKFEAIKALPGNAKELSGRMRAKAFAIANALKAGNVGLRLYSPGRPATQEFAVKDAVAEKIPFKFSNDLGKFDKSVRVDSDGHRVTGGEIEYFTPEFADAYIRMPMVFSESLKEYNANIKLHLAVLRDMRVSLRAMRPRGLRLPTAFTKSATVRGVS